MEKSKKIIDRLYISLSALIMLLAILISYSGTIKETIRNNKKYETANKNYNYSIKEQQKHISSKTKVSPLPLIEKPKFDPSLPYKALEGICFDYSGEPTITNLEGNCSYTIGDFKSKSLFLAALCFIFYIISTGLILFLIRAWCIWLFKD